MPVVCFALWEIFIRFVSIVTILGFLFYMMQNFLLIKHNYRMTPVVNFADFRILLWVLFSVVFVV